MDVAHDSDGLVDPGELDHGDVDPGQLDDDGDPATRGPGRAAPDEPAPGDVRDELPADLQPDEFVGEYEFPDNSRRRWQGAIYLAFALGCVVVWVVANDRPWVNRGWLWAAVGLAAFGIFAISSGWKMHVDEQQALVRAQQAVGFPVGYASAQQVWRGLRSRPTWRVLCYSTEDPPLRRGLVAVDAVDGAIIEQLVQPADPAEWDS